MPPKTLLAIGETMAMVTPVVATSIVDADTFLVDAGGAESNVAAHVAALGHRAVWFSRLGAGSHGSSPRAGSTCREWCSTTGIRRGCT